MTVLVAIPYWTTAAPYIDEAVASALAQTERDLVVMVAGDGVEPPVTVRDPRLVVVSFPTNEGAPATQQAMLLASPFEWYAPMGADDRLDPDYLEGLLAGSGKARSSWRLYHFDDEREWVKEDFAGNPAHTEFGIFDTDTLRSVGGYGVERRCGQDTLLYLGLLPHVTPIDRMPGPRYHKRLHGASLTHDEATGHGSAYRTEVITHNDAVMTTLVNWGFGDLARIRAFREWLARDQADMMLERERLVRMALSLRAVAA